MKRVLALASAFLFAAGMAVAQDNNTQSSTQQPTVDSNNLRGCLTAGGDQFKITTDIGAKVINLNVDKKSATPYVAHEVEVQGMSTPDGTFRVDRILDLADHCGHAGQATTDTSMAKDVTDVNRQAAKQSNDLPNGNATHTENPVKGPYEKNGAVASNAGSATMTDQTAANQTPATSTDTSATSSTPAQQSNATSATAPSSSSSTDMSAQNSAQNNAASSSTSTTDTTAQSSSVASSSLPATSSSGVATDQNAQSSQNSAATAPSTSSTQSTTSTTDQSAQSSTASNTADQNANQNAAADQNANAGKQLPQTGSPLPLLGLLGLGSLAAGVVSRKRK